MKIYLRIAAVVIGAQFWSLNVWADESADTIGSLKKQIEILSEKVQALENENHPRDNEDGKKKAPPVITAGSDGFSFRSADTNYVLRLRGYGQVDARYFPSSSPGRDTFTIRRLRAVAEGTVAKNFDFKVMADLGSGITATTTNNNFLQDAYLNIHYWPEFQVQIGKFKEPVSLEVLQSDANLLFAERGLPTQLAPNRDVGIQFQGDLFDNALSYAVGAFNGVPDGGSGDIETADNDKDIAARLFAQPFKNTKIEPLRGLGLGVGASFGNQHDTPSSYSTLGREKFFSYRSGTGASAATANVTAAGQHVRFAPQGYYYWGPFGLFGEYDVSSQKLEYSAGATHRRLRAGNTSWNVAASYYLTGEHNGFTPPNPLQPLSLEGKEWGAWEVAARFGQLSVDSDAFPLFASTGSARGITSWGLGLNWYLNKHVKFNFDYERASFDGGSTKAGAVTAQDEQVFVARTQFSF